MFSRGLLVNFSSFFRCWPIISAHTHTFLLFRAFIKQPPAAFLRQICSTSPLVSSTVTENSNNNMLSELECGICFRLFDAGRRCPRQLDCKHSFCETCLLTLAGCRSEEPESGSRIICAFCRHSTPLSLSEDTLKGILPVDEDILVRLEDEGVLYESASDREDDDDEEPRPETASQSKDDLPRTRRGRLWKSVKSLYKKIKGSNRQGCITNSEITDLALMACYMM